MDEAFFSKSPRTDKFNSVEDQLVRGQERVLASRHTSVGRSSQICFWCFLASLMIYELVRGVFYVSSSC